MPVVFRLERGSGVPAYVQLMAQARHALRVGAVGVGEQMPTARQVVEALGINPNTVLKAYRMLEMEGLLETQPGRGTFVLRTLENPRFAELGELRERLEAVLADAAASGLTREDIESLVAEVLETTGPVGADVAGTGGRR